MAKKAERKENYKVIIAGSRGFSNYKLLKENCDKFLSEKKKTHNIIIVSGGARGADTLDMIWKYTLPIGKNTVNQRDLEEMNRWLKLLML